MPRQNPCQSISDTNPAIKAVYEDFTSWKNGRAGAIFEKMGSCEIVNFTVADNAIAGIEFSVVSSTNVDGEAYIKDAVVIGYTENDEGGKVYKPHGIITPRTENFWVKGAKFFNFTVTGSAALGSCSHCEHPSSTDSGARTVRFERIYFNSDVLMKIKYQYPFRDIYYDSDGKLTGLLPGSWCTNYWKHNEWAGKCE